MGDSVFYIVSIAQLPALLPVQKQEVQQPAEPLQRLKSGRDGHSPKAWLFQSSPILYDLRGALKSLQEQVWSASRYAKEIWPGDRVYVWEAGRQGGIAAVAEIKEPARLQPEPPEQLPFAKVAQSFVGDRLRVKLKVLTVIDPLIPRESIASNPELSALGVLRCSRGTNFRLSLDQWRALNSLVQDRVAP